MKNRAKSWRNEASQIQDKLGDRRILKEELAAGSGRGNIEPGYYSEK